MTDPNITTTLEVSNVSQVVATFQRAVIDRFSITLANRQYNYREYLNLPISERSNDEADAVDQQFARYVLEWLGFGASEWNYNRPQAGQKANRPDYIITGAIGTAFIWEDKNSTLELTEEHLVQMRRYCVGTAGYAIWCNMRRILAVRFLPSEALKYEILADVVLQALLDLQAPSWHVQATNLALFRLLFSKDRFTRFVRLVQAIAVDEPIFKQRATSLTHRQAMHGFIEGSRQTLEHLKLAALAQIRKSLEQQTVSLEEGKSLYQEWEASATEFLNKLGYVDTRSKSVQQAIQDLTARLGKISVEDFNSVKGEVEKAIGTKKLSASVSSLFEQWRDRAVRLNAAFLTRHFQSTAESFRIADAYAVWSERQSDKDDVKPETFAEQVAYVFFIHLLLVRVLEDKGIIQPRLASDGGFDDWRSYVEKHFGELYGTRILNQNFHSLLVLKAGQYYLHFFEQAVFDWFTPDDFLLIETLEFLCRYNFQDVASDIIGFTYEEYIDRTARNRKGHFLTRDEVVDYMLDLLEYEGPQVLGRRILDPACGSGSFLVHAARRYRHALIKVLCEQQRLPVSETSLSTNPELRKKFAQRYLDDLTHLFFGIELNPFACYLAEMNLLIQGLDDLFVLQQGSIDRFQIFNTDGLDLPREVLYHTDVTGTTTPLWVPMRLSDRIVDEAFPLKAKHGDYAQGFFFIISNPPYINASQVPIKRNYSAYPFYAQVLSGATNTYLLFLRIGMHYLGAGGRMVYIVPLTILGDASAASARKLLTQPPFRPIRVVRFFSGNILFPGVDQAVAMLRVDRDVMFGPDLSPDEWDIRVGGGYTVREARRSESTLSSAFVLHSTPIAPEWQAAWLVSSEASSYGIWNYVKSHATSTLGQLWQEHFEIRQGDVRSDHVSSFRLGQKHRPMKGDIAIQKGEDVLRYAPIASNPSDWARPKTMDIHDSRSRAVNATLLRIQQLAEPEQGITLRKIARLNTRERLTATWFERDRNNPFIFPDEQWRFRILPQGDLGTAKGILALLNSRVVAYLVNLFSTNNNVAQKELARLLIPDSATFPVAQLAGLANILLEERTEIERDFVLKYRAVLPEVDEDAAYIPPSAVLATTTQMLKLSLGALVEQGIVRNMGPENGKIVSLRTRGLIECTDTSYTRVLDLFLAESQREDETWVQAQNWQLPDTVVTVAWLRVYDTLRQQIQTRWDTFVALQRQVDEVVADWYGFDAEMRHEIAQGLPWTKRRVR